MYESHFGFSGAPFRLNPDPTFFFGSSGHSNAMAYMRFGVDQGEGFVVVTGDVGAGKTTLVRTLMEDIDDDAVVAAHVGNTQLESGELLQAIVTAFGLPTRSASKAELLSNLERFLTEVANHDRRALLIVDEAQNLGLEAIEELRMLSNFQLGNHALLQSFLVGQPELRKHLQSPAMEQFRQRIIASCHLGPLSAEETRGYIEHRLRCVGWRNHPVIADDAHEAIHRWTGGIPRRINLLCNRLLLAAYSGQTGRITAPMVEETAADALRETAAEAMIDAATAAAPAAADASVEPAVARLESTRGNALAGVQDIQFIERAPAALQSLVRPLVCVADTPLGLLQFTSLARAMRAVPGLPAVVLLNPGLVETIESDLLVGSVTGSVAVEAHLGVPDGGPAGDRIAAVTLRMGQALDELAPAAVISIGASDAVLSCVHLAVKRHVPVARLGAGQRRDPHTPERDLNAALLDRMSQFLYTPALATHHVLHREGIPAERMLFAGDLLVDELRRLAAEVPPVPQLLRQMGLSGEQKRRALRGFVVVTAQLAEGDLSSDDLERVVQLLRDLGHETLVIWLASGATAHALRTARLDVPLQRSGVVVNADADYLTQIGLLRGATCVVAGPAWRLIDEAGSLEVPGIVVHPNGKLPGKPAGGWIVEIPCDTAACVRAMHEVVERAASLERDDEAAEGAATHRVVEHLRRWLPATGPRAPEPRVAAGMQREADVPSKV